MNKPVVYMVLAGIALAGLIKFGAFDSAEVALCKEAMGLNAQLLKPGAEGEGKLIAGCQRDANQIPADRWRCVIAAMKKGGGYRESLTQCTT
jgi:hypothetical protein